MSQIFDEKGNVIPLTLVQAGPCYITQVKTKEKSDKYEAIQVGFVELETFIPDADFEQIKAWEDTFQKGQAIIKKAKNPNDVVDRVADLIGEKSFPLHIQSEISKRMKMRLEQIQAMKDLSSIWKE